MIHESKYVGFELYEDDCLEASINQQIVEKYTEIDERGRMLRAPKNDEELEEFIYLAYGLKFPNKVITPGHKTPFQFLADMFFERVKTALGFANRTGGKTYLIATLNHLDMVFKKNCKITSAGATRDQAGRCYRYFQDHNHLPWFKKFCERYAITTGSGFYEDMWSTQARTEFGNKAILEVITGSAKGFRGPHPNKSRVDEIDEIPWHVLQIGMSMSQSTGGVVSQDVFTSTRQHEYGAMQRLLDEAEDRMVTVYEWNIWETLEKCERRCIDDPVHGTCPVISYCNGKAHDCAGYYKISDFISSVKKLDKDRFAMEWENSKPAKDKFVYPDFSKERHMMTPEKLFKMTQLSAPSLYWTRIAALDFGSSPGNPFVYLKLCRLPTGAWMVFHEYYMEQRLLRDHARAITASPGWTSGECIYADHDAQDRLELLQYGIKTRAAVKGPKSVGVGIDKIGELLKGRPPLFTPELYVWHECVETIKEFERYQWPIRDDGLPDRSGLPKPGYDHAMDSVRYAVFSDYRLGQSKYRTRSIPGI